MIGKIEEMKLISRCVLFDDRDAFGMLVEAYQGDLRRFFTNLTFGDRALSCDLAQETFIKAYLNIRSFKGLSGFGTWLYRIGYNEFYAYKRRRGECFAEEATEPEGGFSPGDDADARIDVERAMRALSYDEHVVVTLFYINDKTIREVSKITGMPDGTVKSHLSRAKVKMGKYLKNHL